MSGKFTRMQARLDNLKEALRKHRLSNVPWEKLDREEVAEYEAEVEEIENMIDDAAHAERDEA